ncbi:non-specific lipid-transfer protein-like [Belonocnema kinseyi]|uniref:non-specific lipid-transfer protein-like n=1 Tax=Belonocnema kinseyi TaxID=2817044 RepID=UPI00143D5E1F|nr:non-specific lipid-transfer protein-like [Belonocnema kinseyi]XP_033209757.1 non-specific lipid-transfer protein-like [Belonocnema kinseyi]XP_033209758.1 non-specific lipid-transfer protein-like [Belonocnema kinseyi]
MAQKPKVYVVGVGMTKFEKPGRRENFDYNQMGKEATLKALEDAGISYNEVKAACVGYVYGDSTCGQRALYEVGLTGCPVYNVNNNCSTGSTALLLAKQIIESRNADCVLALGFEKMERGSLSSKYFDRTNPMDKHITVMADITGINDSPLAAQLFGNAGIEHMKKYGTKPEHFGKIAYKNHLHSMNNPYSQFQDKYTLEQIMNSPKIFGPLTKLQCCPTSDGSAAVVLANEEFVVKHNLQSQAVEIVGMEMSTDLPSTFEDRSCMKIVGYDMTKNAADKLFSNTQYRPSDVQVVELHDCFSANELITYEALGLCAPGKAGELIDSGNNTYGGKYVVNPSGGLISKGHPLGATGLAQCSELCWQLRGQAGKRQVPGAKLALQHNIGLGGAVVVALYRLGFPQAVRRNNVAATADPSKFKANTLLQALEVAMQEDEEGFIEGVRGIYGLKVTSGPDGAEGYWVINAKVGKGKVEYNGKDKPDVIFTISDTDVVDFISGKLNPQKAFFQGKVKIQGNMGLAMKLPDLQKRASKKIEHIRSKL